MNKFNCIDMYKLKMFLFQHPVDIIIMFCITKKCNVLLFYFKDIIHHAFLIVYDKYNE